MPTPACASRGSYMRASAGMLTLHPIFRYLAQSQAKPANITHQSQAKPAGASLKLQLEPRGLQALKQLSHFSDWYFGRHFTLQVVHNHICGHHTDWVCNRFDMSFYQGHTCSSGTKVDIMMFPWAMNHIYAESHTYVTQFSPKGPRTACIIGIAQLQGAFSARSTHRPRSSKNRGEPELKSVQPCTALGWATSQRPHRQCVLQGQRILGHETD